MLPKNIPEERVAGILARAAELDRQTIPLDALRSAAVEAGISKFGALALVVGIIGTRDVSLATVAVSWLIATAGYLAWRDRGLGNPTRFQVNTLVMCALFFIGMAGAAGNQEALGFVAIISIALLILGTLIIHFGDARQTATHAE